MSRRRDEERAPVLTTEPSRFERIAGFAVLAAAALVPVCLGLRGHDIYREPKQLLLYGLTIVAVWAIATAALLGGLTDRDAFARLRLPLFVAAGGIGWCILSTLFSHNRPLSVAATLWALALAALFLIASYTFRRVSPDLLSAAIFIPALVNGAIVLLQATQVWNPWVFPEDTTARRMNNALLGNPDDVGVYLAAPVLFALARTFAARGPRQIVFATITMVLTAALVSTATMTALIALAFGGTALLLCSRRRALTRAAIAAPIAVIVLMLAYPGTYERIISFREAIVERSGGAILSGRVVPFAAAAEMFRDRPLTGVGPGVFKSEYMPYRLRIEEKYPKLAVISRTADVNFAETHNDHLQVLAEAGFPAYIALIAAFVLVARISLSRRAPRNEREELARLTALPMTVLLSAAMLAQFPLQLAAPAVTYVLLGAACMAWSDDDVAA